MGKLRTAPFKLYFGNNENDSNAIVRFTDDDKLGIGLSSGGIAKVIAGRMVAGGTEEQPEYLGHLSGQLRATLWVEVVDSWAKDGNWGGHLKVACAHLKGQYLDSKSGWVRAYSKKYDPVTFVDKDDYYEIWQGDAGTGKPLSVEGGVLRFMSDRTNIGQWNIKDA